MLEDGRHPLDWNGPTGRIFIQLGDEDLDRSISITSRASASWPDAALMEE
jgi:hypothetical protein